MNAPHGVFAPTSRLRARVVPRPTDEAAPSAAAPPPPTTTEPPPERSKSTSVRSTYRLDWAALLKRVFAVDVLECSRCRGPMRLIACIEEQAVARKILLHLGLPYPFGEPRRDSAPVLFYIVGHEVDGGEGLSEGSGSVAGAR